jgi:hypothetical protein
VVPTPSRLAGSVLRTVGSAAERVFLLLGTLESEKGAVSGLCGESENNKTISVFYRARVRVSKCQIESPCQASL